MDFTKDIYINKDIIFENSDIVILYKGILFSDNLTNDLYISYGYGKMWENKNEIKMKPSTFGYLATVSVATGENLQFCFRNNENKWDNNNGENYILPLQENKEETPINILDTIESNVKIETISNPLIDIPNQDEEKETENKISLETTIVSSNTINFLETTTLENISKQSIPNDTIFTQIKTEENAQNQILNSTIQSIPEETIISLSSFTELTEKAKQQSVKAFDEGKVTAGSVYVNSLMQDLENENSLTTSNVNKLKEPSILDLLFANIKLVFSKVKKLVKSTFNIKENNE